MAQIIPAVGAPATARRYRMIRNKSAMHFPHGAVGRSHAGAVTSIATITGALRLDPFFMLLPQQRTV